jgi:hypothetical protein
MRSNTVKTKIGIPPLQGDKLSGKGAYKPTQFSARRKSYVMIQLIRLFTKRGSIDQTLLNTKEEQQTSDYRRSHVQTKVPILKSVDP